MHFTITDPDNQHDVIYDGENPRSALAPGSYPATVTYPGGEAQAATVTISETTTGRPTLSYEVYTNDNHRAAREIARTDTGTTIATFLAGQGVEAHELAEQVGGRVTSPFNEYGGYAVRVDDAEGKAVPVWNGNTLPEGTTLQRRDSVRAGDVVVSSHSGQRSVIDAKTYGDPGTTYLTLVPGPHSGPEAYPGDSLIPVVSRAAVAAFGPRQQETAALHMRNLQRDLTAVEEALADGDLDEVLRHVNTLVRDGAVLRDLTARAVRKAERESGLRG